MLLAVLVARAHGWLVFSLLPTKTPRLFSAELVPLQAVLACTTQGILPSRAEDCCCVEFHKVPVSLFLQPVQVPLNGNPALKYVDWCPQFDVISKLNAINLYSKMFTDALGMISSTQWVSVCVSRAVAVHKSAVLLG